MITRTFKLCLNAGTGSAPFINVSQTDRDETWLFELYTETGERYIPSSGAIIGIKSDGYGIANTGTVDSEGRVVITETEQITASAGRAIYELSIDGLTHGTANFIVNVEKKPIDGAIMSDSDLSLISQAIDSAAVIVDVIGDGDPSEVIGEHVDAWLDNHPEATTTVQDGAITAPKINNSLWDKLLVSEEASGAVASFEDGADDVPVSSLKVALEPIQLGSGDPSPNNIRPIVAANGKNLLNTYVQSDTVNNVAFTVNSDGTVTVNGTANGNADFYFVGASATYASANIPTGSYKFSGCPLNGTGAMFIVENGGPTYSVTNNSETTVSIDSTKTYRIFIRINNGKTVTNEKLSPMLRLASITDPSYQPYQGIMVEQTNGNLINPSDFITVAGTTKAVSGDSITISGDGSSQYQGIQIGKNTQLTFPAGTYYVKAKIGSITHTNYRMLMGFRNGSNTFVAYETLSLGQMAFTVSTSVDTFFCITVNGTENSANTVVLENLIVSKIDMPYEPYVSPITYPYSLGQNVYGGSVDLATGVLTVDRIKWTPVVTGVSSVTMTDGNAGYRFSNYTQTPEHDTAHVAETLSNFVKYSGNWVTPLSVCPSTSSANTVFICLPSSLGITTASDFNNWVTTNDYYVVYPLATPQIIQLTPQEVKTLLGYNNISSSGTVDVIYHADTKLYVDKMTNVDNAIIAPTEVDFVATRNYTTNDLVIVNDTLYKVTANIATGSAITPNSNVTQTTLGALIKALS